VGFLLSVGSVAFLVATLRTARLVERVPRRPAVAVAALLMGALLVPVLNVTPAVWFTLALFSCMAVCAGVRSTGSSGLGLVQLPDQPGSMMAARTTSAQLGYMVGAVLGGVVLAVADFGTLGFVLFAGMGASAWLVLRVRDPMTDRLRRPAVELPAAVPD
jgi:predicted MFS family arabinose efflux permease